jgi:GntR family transcriptional regulator
MLVHTSGLSQAQHLVDRMNISLLKPLDPHDTQPLYQQLQRAVRDAIDTHALGPDDALPSERQLAEEFAVSRITVRRAIEGLAEEGWLVRRQGSGNFVSSRVEKNFAKLTSFSEDMRARGSRPHSVWLKRSQGTVTPEEALVLRLSPGAPVFRLHRLRYADNAPPPEPHDVRAHLVGGIPVVEVEAKGKELALDQLRKQWPEFD